MKEQRPASDLMGQLVRQRAAADREFYHPDSVKTQTAWIVLKMVVIVSVLAIALVLFMNSFSR